MRTKTLRRRTPGLCELFVAARPIATRAEKILLGLPSHPLLRPQKPLSEPCGASCVVGIALGALLFPGRSRGISAALCGGATSWLLRDMPSCSNAPVDDLGERPCRSLLANIDVIVAAAVDDSYNVLDLFEDLEDLLVGPWEVRAPRKLSLGGDSCSSPGRSLCNTISNTAKDSYCNKILYSPAAF
jgi:hypothetical protein